MARRKFHPPLNKRFVRTVEGFDVYTVDAFAIRNAAQPDEEFDNVAIHGDFPDIIPEGAIWTARSTWEKEGRFFLANAVAELKALESKKTKSDAYDAGIAAEQRLRQKETGIAYRDGRPHRRVPDEIYVSHYCHLSDEQEETEVWIVAGHLVRCYYKTDYTEGGHGYVYPWIPHGQIWIERSIEKAEVPYILAHEYIESRLMRDDGLEYDKAHELCAEMEFDLRQFKSRVKFPGLSRRRLTKDQMNVITRPDFFEYVEKRYKRGMLRRVKALISDAASKVLKV
jgi:hypothetical protein